MKVEFKRRFVKDLERVRAKGIRERVRTVIAEVERAQTLQEIGDVRKLRGSDRYYRIRVGDYRLGLIVEGDVVTFVRILHRKEIYRYFP